MKNSLLLVMLALLLASCTSAPKGIAPVANFNLQHYLGTWYEIARLDHSFERGLDQVTASYLLRGDGGIRVINRGYSSVEKKWSEAEGKAYFVARDDLGHLKVSFFGPFYGAYVVFELDPQYRYAFVSGPNRNYLWLLARTPQVSSEIKQQFITKALQLGFDTRQLIFPDQKKTEK